MEETRHLLPRVGMLGRCVLENGESSAVSVSYSYHSNRIEFSELDEKNH